MKNHKVLYSFILLPVIGLLFLTSCKEKTFDARGTWILKDSLGIPLNMSGKIRIHNVIFVGTTKIGEVFPLEKNLFSLFSKTYYYIEREKIEITGKMDEYRKVTFSGKFLNENKLEGTWFYLQIGFGNDKGYWEATRVIEKKNSSVPRQ